MTRRGSSTRRDLRVLMLGTLLLGALLLGTLLLASGPARAQSASGFPIQAGVDDVRISTMGIGGRDEGIALALPASPAVETSPLADYAIVAWAGLDGGNGFSIFVRKIDLATGAPVGDEVPMLPFSQGADLAGEWDVACDESMSTCYVGWVQEVTTSRGDPVLLPVLRKFDPRTMRAVGDPVVQSNAMAVLPGVTAYLSLQRVQYFDEDRLRVVFQSASYLFQDGSGQQTEFPVRVQTGSLGWDSETGRASYSGPVDRPEVVAGKVDFACVEILIGLTCVSAWTGQGPTGNEIFVGDPDNPLRISRTESAGLVTGAGQPRIVLGPRGSGRSLLVDWQLLVVWVADGVGGTSDNEYEVYGQLLGLEADLTTGQMDIFETGPDDFPISAVGPFGNANRNAKHPAVAYDPRSGFYVVTWAADDGNFFLANNEFEIFGQAIDRDGNLQRAPALRISRMGGPDIAGGTGDSRWDAEWPAVVAAGGKAFVAWWGDEQFFPVFIGGDTWSEEEIFGQLLRLEDELIFADGFESGTTSAW